MLLGIELVILAFVIVLWLVQPKMPPAPLRETPDSDSLDRTWSLGYRAEAYIQYFYQLRGRG